jgi:hypothetical protein
MSTSYGNIPIVTSGLTLCLDAGNLKSYPTSGTTWTDLSKNGNNGTVVNSPTFSSSNVGSLVFNGSNQYVTLTYDPILTNQVTFETWVSLSATSPNNVGTIFSRETIAGGSYRMLYSSGWFSWICATVNNGWYTTGTNIFANVDSFTNIYQVVGTYNGSNLRLYVNGVLMSTGASISGNILSTGTFYLIRREANNTDYGKGIIYTHRIYNRALSASEVLQNYNATKWRFQ